MAAFTADRPAKRATNLSIDAELLDQARQLGLNVSQVCEASLREHVRQELTRRWKTDHADFIAAYNDVVAAEGLPLDAWRSF